MIVNGKEVRLFYSIFVKCEIDRLAVVGGYRDAADMMKKAPTESTVKVAAAMSAAWCANNDGEPVTADELMALSASDFLELDRLVTDALIEGSHTTVNVAPSKGKNAKSAGRSS